MTDGIESRTGAAVPVIPEEVHGFSVKVAIGPYPIDAPATHRRAVYAELRPTTDHTRAILRRMNREYILGMVPLTAQAALDVQADPDGRIAEDAALVAVRQASTLARDVDRSR